MIVAQAEKTVEPRRTVSPFRRKTDAAYAIDAVLSEKVDELAPEGTEREQRDEVRVRVTVHGLAAIVGQIDEQSLCDVVELATDRESVRRRIVLGIRDELRRRSDVALRRYLREQRARRPSKPQRRPVQARRAPRRRVRVVRVRRVQQATAGPDDGPPAPSHRGAARRQGGAR